jgi:hypothetical protein
MWKSFVLELHGESSELAGERIGLLSPIDFGSGSTSRHPRNVFVRRCRVEGCSSRNEAMA